MGYQPLPPKPIRRDRAQPKEEHPASLHPEMLPVEDGEPLSEITHPIVRLMKSVEASCVFEMPEDWDLLVEELTGQKPR